MKRKIINLLVVSMCSLVLVEILFNKTLVFDTISYSLKIWISSIFPSLFPFFIISDLLIKYNVTNYIPKGIKSIFRRFFKVSDNVVTIFFLSMISGFPSNARNTKMMYDMGRISLAEANHALIFTHFSNPLFILGTVAVFFLHNETYGYIILTSHYLANVILGILFKKYNNATDNKQINVCLEDVSFAKAFASAIKRAIDTLLMILGTLTCFLVLSSIIINRFDLNSYNAMILKGILEITMGIREVANLHIGDIYKVVLSSMFISFGGLSVHMQVLSFLVDSDISYKYFFIARIFHCIIAGFISYLLFGFII